MPTYKNISDKPILIDGLGFAPGEEKTTYKILKHPDLVKVSDEPYLPLSLSETKISVATAGEEVSVPIDVERCKVIEILDITTQIEIRANSSANPYPRTAEAGDRVVIKHDREIEALYIKFPVAAGSCKVIQKTGGN